MVGKGFGNASTGVRASALWGKGGRGHGLRLIGLVVATLTVLAPLAAAGGRDGAPRPGGTYVAASLLAQAEQRPGEKIRIIVQAPDLGAAERATHGLGSLRKRLAIVNAVAIEIPAARLAALARVPGLTITPDAPAKTSATYRWSRQLWPYTTGSARLWQSDPAYEATMPTIAVVDSGIDASRADFGGRILAEVDLGSDPDSAGDGRGHGTFVAAMAAGGANPYNGAAPLAKLVSIDVMDDEGRAYTSDVIAASEWILRNKDAYGIRVANFSLHSATPSNFTHDPLDRAVEKLWFSGIVVVAAAGNYGSADGPSGVRYAPGNDPFVITVGALDTGRSPWAYDDAVAPFSAYGYTYDGFWKPEVAAAGRYVVAAVPTSSTLTAQRAENLVSPGYIQLSGTSFAAPIVAGTAAQILARHPEWTPDQVKGALMATARSVPNDVRDAAGMGQITASRAAEYRGTPPNPNLGLYRFVVADPLGGAIPVFDAVSWSDVIHSDVSWDSVSWSDVSWSDVSWSDVSWSDVSWSDVSWSDVSWSDVSWSDVSWADSAEADANATGGYDVAGAEADLASDPDIGLPLHEIGEPVVTTP